MVRTRRNPTAVQANGTGKLVIIFVFSKDSMESEKLYSSVHEYHIGKVYPVIDQGGMPQEKPLHQCKK